MMRSETFLGIALLKNWDTVNTTSIIFDYTVNITTKFKYLPL